MATRGGHVVAATVGGLMLVAGGRVGTQDVGGHASLKCCIRLQLGSRIRPDPLGLS